MPKDALVFSTDANQMQKCARCKRPLAQCLCRNDDVVDADKVTAHLRIEKAGRRGKTVTVVSRLPIAAQFLRTLAAELKSKCGSGGSFSVGATEGIIEIQGDKRELIREILVQKGIKVKG